MYKNSYVIPGAASPEKLACAIWNVNSDILHTKVRLREVVECRYVLLDHLTQTSGLSSYKIGKKLGKDHGTVLHARKTVNNLKETDKEFRRKHELFLNAVN